VPDRDSSGDTSSLQRGKAPKRGEADDGVVVHLFKKEKKKKTVEKGDRGFRRYLVERAHLHLFRKGEGIKRFGKKKKGRDRRARFSIKGKRIVAEVEKGNCSSPTLCTKTTYQGNPLHAERGLFLPM